MKISQKTNSVILQ